MSLFSDAHCRNGIPLGTQIRRKLDVGDNPAIIGKAVIGSAATIRGNPVIFRWRPGYGQEQMTYYHPANPQTEAQQAWRAIFAAGIAAWKALSEEEKDIWRTKASKRGKVGQHLFQSYYLNTHKS